MRTIVVLLGLLFAAIAARAQTALGTMLDVAGRRAERCIVTLGEEPPAWWGERLESRPEMERRLDGVIADLRGPELQKLRAALPASPRIGDASGTTRLAVLHLIAGKDRRRVSLQRSIAGEWVLVEMDGVEEPRRAALDAAAMGMIWAGWPVFLGDPAAEAADVRTGVVERLEGPLSPGMLKLDRAMLGARFDGGREWKIDPAARDLTEESMWVRVPKGYSPRRPAGLVVWVSPTDDGRVPEMLGEGADELGLIVVSANRSGNLRSAPDRYQLALDAAQTCLERYHVDRGRVYIAGFSGGGKVAATMVACVPEVFRGGVAIGGMAFWSEIPTGTGGFWAATFGRPSEATVRLLKRSRLAAITGNKDFNQRQTQNGLEQYARAGLSTRLWDIEGLGHELPSPAVCRDALAWVEEDRQPMRADGEGHAREAKLPEYRPGMRTAESPAAERQRVQRLREVMAAAPWSDAAWRAFTELRGAGK